LAQLHAILLEKWKDTMACTVYEQLLSEYKSAQTEWAYFAYPQNKALRGTSDRKSKLMANAAKGKMSEISKRMRLHQQGCSDCSAGAPS
jgi:hypothetical protein